MAEEWTEKPVSWTIKDIGAPLLDTLAKGTYSQLQVLREYVQNAIDSYARFTLLTGREPSNTVQIQVDVENAAVHIMDSGVCMNADDIDTAKKIAVSPKLPSPEEYVGFRGIGIWSGLSACEQLIIVTTKFGDPHQYRLTIDCKGIVEHLNDPITIDTLLEGRFKIYERPGEKGAHFTHVKLANIDREKYGELLDVMKMTKFAEESLPVPFDPQWDYREAVEKLLEDVPFTKCYNMTIDGSPVFRRFPPKGEVKAPELVTIKDDHKRDVGYAWVCETAKPGPTKAIDDKKYLRHFAVRVKNFAIGQRNLYANQDVSDLKNLDWFVGEIYIIDQDIRPDAKRANFEPSEHHDAVISALRKTYTSIALRARAWSLQVVVEGQAKTAMAKVAEIKDLLATSGNLNEDKIRDLWQDVEGLRKNLEDALAKANETRAGAAERTLIVRRYLRKKEVKHAVETAIGAIAGLRELLEHNIPTVVSGKSANRLHDNALPIAADQFQDDKPVSGSKSGADGRKASKSLTERLHGDPVSTAAAVSAQTVVGMPINPSQLSFEHLTLKGDVAESTDHTDLETVIDAFRAAAAAVLGEASDNYHQIMDRLPDELRRRGVNV